MGPAPTLALSHQSIRAMRSIMQIISADERLGERRGAKALIIGPTGVGKTSLLAPSISSDTLRRH